jgi:hypothetical protein
MNTDGLPPLDEYSRRATLDARDAMALALKRFLEGVRFDGVDTDRFQQVFDEWPGFLDCEAVPVATVLPAGEYKYDASRLSPDLLEDTWEPDGMPGWGLWKTADVVSELTIAIRTNLVPERSAIKRAIEDAFQSSEQLLRYGLMLPLPEYYGLLGRFALLAGNVIDNEEAAMRDKRDAVFTVSAMVPKVQVLPVWPMALRITKTIETTAGDVISIRPIAV